MMLNKTTMQLDSTIVPNKPTLMSSFINYFKRGANNVTFAVTATEDDRKEKYLIDKYKRFNEETPYPDGDCDSTEHWKFRPTLNQKIYFIDKMLYELSLDVSNGLTEQNGRLTKEQIARLCVLRDARKRAELLK